MLKNIVRLVKEEEGASMIEYGLLAALIAAVLVGVITTIGTTLNTKFGVVKDALQ